ncbi:MAG: acyl-CoA dehydrogenase family protein, partial [Candidatus Binatia bacterium]|nr:acyl-CoA dehydrogenase family protein [Candidatus Binatia bacterium]
MVDFAFTEEQELFRQAVREFAEQELAPGYLKRARSDDPPWDVMSKMRDQGLLCINVPEEYGGQGADHVTLGIAIEEISRAD